MKTMLRVRSSALVPDDAGILRYGDLPFSGLAYDVDGDGIVRAIHEMKEGRITGPSADWIDLPAGGVRVDWSFLEHPEDYGPRRFRGAPFTGVTYFFNTRGICVAEFEYIDGFAAEISQRKWYENGEPKEITGSGQSVGFFPDGRLQWRATAAGLLYNLIVRDDGRLGGIVLRDATLFDLATIRTMTFSDELMLLGAAVDTPLLRVLRDRTGLGAVQKLRLMKTGIDRDAIEVIVSLPTLKELWLSQNPRLGAAEARQIETLRWNCVVHFEPAVQ